MTFLMCILQIDNIVNVEALTITSLLVGYIYILREEVKTIKKEMKDQGDNHTKAINDQATYYRNTIKDLVEKNDTLQNEKYQVTREVIPLLIELIQKLDKEEKNEQRSN